MGYCFLLLKVIFCSYYLRFVAKLLYILGLLLPPQSSFLRDYLLLPGLKVLSGGGGLVTNLYPTLIDPMDCSPPRSSVRGILPAWILEWVAISFSRGSSQPRDRTWISWIAGGFFTVWAARFFLLVIQWLQWIVALLNSAVFMCMQKEVSSGSFYSATLVTAQGSGKFLVVIID